MTKLTRIIAAAGLAFSGLAILGSQSEALDPAKDFCGLSADQAARSCQVGARSDQWLALGKCLNLSSASAQKACRQQSLADLKDALDECDSQDEARDPVCERLGKAPYDPVINPANFVATIDNPYFPLTPGTTFVYEGQTAAGFEHSEFAVTHNTKVILGVTCIEVHDTVMLDGELTEDTLDWFAQDSAGNVWYFGENSKELEDGLVVSLEGSWTAGVDGARPGIVMEASPAVGDFYRQEFSLQNAEDLAEVVSLNQSVTVPAGTFNNCLETEETSPLEPDALEHKSYSAGVGNVLTVDLTTGERSELVQIIVGP